MTAFSSAGPGPALDWARESRWQAARHASAVYSLPRAGCVGGVFGGGGGGPGGALAAGVVFLLPRQPASCRSAVIIGDPRLPLCSANSRRTAALSRSRRARRGERSPSFHL